MVFLLSVWRNAIASFRHLHLARLPIWTIRTSIDILPFLIDISSEDIDQFASGLPPRGSWTEAERPGLSASKPGTFPIEPGASWVHVPF